LIDSIENNLQSQLKPREVYQAKLQELEINSMKKYNMMNVHRLHLNEIDILRKNLDYLQTMRKNLG